MTKAEFVKKVAQRADLSPAEATRAVNAFLDEVRDSLKGGTDVQFAGFGKFSVADRSARQGVNPQTGEKIQIAASKVPKFSAGSALKKAIKATV